MGGKGAKPWKRLTNVENNVLSSNILLVDNYFINWEKCKILAVLANLSQLDVTVEQVFNKGL